MKLKILLSSLVIFNTVIAFSQNVVIKGSVYKIPGKVAVVLCCKQQSNPVSGTYDQLFAIKPDSNNRYYHEFNLVNPSLLSFTYGSIDYQLFVSPNDTLTIDFVEKRAPDTIKNNNETDYFNEEIKVNAQHPQEVMFFDSLITHTQRKFGNLYYPSDNSLDNRQISEKIDQNYTDEVSYLIKYYQKYGISNELIKCALNEIRGDYILKYIGKIILNNQNPEALNFFKEKIKDEYFSSTICETSRFYSVAVVNYLQFCLTKAYLVGPKAIIENFSSDSKLRDYLLTDQMRRYLQVMPSNYKSFLDNYCKICKNKEYVNGILEQYNALVNKKTSGLDSNFTKQFVHTIHNKKATLGSLLNKNKPLLINFWASWCGPCIVEMPLLKKFEDKYKDRIDFFYISVDKSTNDWKNAIDRLDLSGNQFLMQDGFTSSLAKYLKMTSVPRIMLFDKSGKIHSYSTIAPSYQKAFDLLLNDCLSK